MSNTTFTLTQSSVLISSNVTTLNLTSSLSLPSPTGSCVIGDVAPQDPADLSIFQHFKAPSQPPHMAGWEIGLKVTFYILAFLVTVTGNTMVILIICLNKRMKSTTNILLLNQAVSDLMVAAVCMWVHLGNSITPEWPFGHFVCKVNTFCQVVAVTASVVTLTAISVERFTAIVYPLKTPWTARTNGVIIAVTWLLAAAVASPHLFVRHLYQQHWKDRHEVWCAEEWPQVYKDEDCNTWEPGKIAYYAVESLVMYFLPVFIMIVAYAVITHRLITRKIPGTLINSTIFAQERAKRKVIKMLVAVLVCFVLCWTPQQVMLLYDVFKPYNKVPLYVKSVKYIALYVAYLNSALNPILYGGFNDNFRRGFKDVFHCIVAKKNNKIHPDGGAVQGMAGSRDTARTTRNSHHPGPKSPTTRETHAGPSGSKGLVEHRISLRETEKTAALFGNPNQQTSITINGCRRRSVHSDDTTHIAWQALQ